MGLYVVLYFFLEVYTTIEVGSYLGGFGMILEIILSFVLGIYIIKNFQYGIASSLSALKSGNITQEEFVGHNIFALIGAVLLLLPGILSDVIGLLLQISFISGMLVPKMKFNQTMQTNDYTYQHKQYIDDNSVIDVEVIEKKIDN